MNPTLILVVIMLLAVAWHVTATILVYDALRKRHVPVNFLFLRFTILKYASQYKEITLKETGKVGPLFYHWILSIVLVMISAVLLLFVRIA